MRELSAGTARAVITPEPGRMMAAGGRFATGLGRDLHARVLVLDDGEASLVFVTYDINCLDVATPLLRAQVQAELGIPPSRLVLLATHNHQAPIQIATTNFDYGRWLAERLFHLIQEAVAAKSAPARLEFGWGHCYGLYSRWESAPVDYEVQVLKVSVQEKTVAILFNQPASPERSGNQDLYHTGHPGYALDAVEASVPGAVALYGMACGGDQTFIERDDLAGTDAAAELRGNELAREVLAVASGSLEDVTGPLDAHLDLVDLPLAPPLPYHEALGLAKEVPLDIGFATVPEQRSERQNNWIRALLRHYREGIPFPTKTSELVCLDEGRLVLNREAPPSPFPCRFVEVLHGRLGRLRLVAIQGEPVTSLGMRIKDKIRQTEPVLLFGYFAEHNLYIPTREMIRQEIYAARVLQDQYGCPVGWDPGVGDAFVEKVLELVENDRGREKE